MIRTTLRWICGTALAFIAYATLSDHPAQAMVTYNSPYGATTPVDIYFGSCVQAGLSCTRIVWVRKSDNACTSQNIADGAGLTDTTRVNGTSGNDFFHSVFGSTSFPFSTPCGGLGTPNYNGHSMAFYGGASTDVGYNSNSGNTWLIGEDGNDFFISAGIGGVTGGNGNDHIETRGSFSNEYVKGDAGDDCLWDTTGTASTFDCGAGNDKAATGAGGHVPASILHCESIVSSC